MNTGRIIFVGVHNNKGFEPLDSRTLSGKRIDKVIDNLSPIKCVKTNLYNVDYLPNDKKQKAKLLYEWGVKYNPTENDIIVLLGKEVANGFYKDALCRKNVIQFHHPSPRNFATRGIVYDETLTKMINGVLNAQECDATKAQSMDEPLLPNKNSKP